jgi:hypothetical protein
MQALALIQMRFACWSLLIRYRKESLKTGLTVRIFTAAPNALIFKGEIMEKTNLRAKLRPLSHWVILSVMLILFSGCQAKESPLSQKTAALVMVVQDMITSLPQP